MSKRLLALLFVGTISLAGVVLAQDPPAKEEPPVRLKKKKPRGDDKPMVDPDKPAETKKDDKVGEKKKDGKAEPEPVTPQEEAAEVLQRVVSNVHKVDERLAKGDLGEATQQTQRDILKDLESLIQRNENPPQGGGGQADQNKDQGGGGGEDQNNQNQQGGGDQNKQNSQGGGQGGGQKNQKQSSGQKSQGGGGQNGGAGQQNQRTPGGGAKSGTKPGAGSQSGKQQRAEGKPKPGNGKPGGNQRAGMDGKNSQKPGGKDGKNGNGGEGGNKGDRALNKNADLDKEVWGHVPQTLRAQMDAYSNPQPFMPKYDDLIKRYYQTIAEQGRRKGE